MYVRTQSDKCQNILSEIHLFHQEKMNYETDTQLVGTKSAR